MKKGKVYFRADGNSKIGLGHVMRCYAIASMLRQEFECHFMIIEPPDYVVTLLESVCSSIIILKSKINLLEEANFITTKYLTGDEIFVIDGYKFETNYQKIIKEKESKIVCIDDIHNYHFHADAILNHAGGIYKEDYTSENNTQFFLGPKYSMLREPFIQASQNRNVSEESNNIFICLGGADPNNDLIKVLKYCVEKKSNKKYYIVLGAAYKHKEILDEFLNSQKLNVTILKNLNAKELVHYMKLCNTAITSPSTISYEYLSVGGLLYLHLTADNQKDIYKYFLTQELAFPLAKYPIKSKSLIKSSLQKQREQFDGKASERITHIFKSLN